ncbi:hypothetical protein EW145_g5360, partial [Phellinidium pouzarii]
MPIQISDPLSPPKAHPVQYKAPLGTRWEKEKAGVPRGTFDLVTDPAQIGPWVLGECVGKGASGRVKVARHCETGQMAAVKILPLETVLSSRLSLRTRENKAEKHRNGIDKEIIMMKLMDHPNIVRIFDVFEGERELFLVLEYVDGGELFDYLVNNGRMEPHKALCYFKQIIYGLAYAHAFAVIHRDLKPENILIASLNPPHLKIADWGMAAFAPPEHHLETSCGSPHYASPEIVRGEPYSGTATDIWSCGVILFALMTGRLPFDDKNIRTLLQKVKSGKFEIPSYVFPEAADLIRRILVVEVDKRITMAEIIAHPFLAHSTPGITYVAAPSISELDRPLRSKALVKQYLLSSLLLICVGYTYDEVISELLSPPGQGSLIKVLYFLLARHRERTLEEYGMQSLFSNDGYNIKHYIAPSMKVRAVAAQAPGLPSSAVLVDSETITNNTQTSQIRTSRVMSPLSPGGPTPESPSPSPANSRTRPTSPLGPRTLRSSYLLHKTRPVSSPPISRDAHREIDGEKEDRTRPRTRTIDGLPLSQQRYDPSAAISLPDAFYPGSPRVRLQTPASSPPDVIIGSDVGGNRTSAVPWLVKPTVEDPILQRAIDDVAKNFGVLMSEGQQGVGLGFGGAGTRDGLEVGASTKAVDEQHECSNPKRLHLGDAGTNSPDFRYSLPNKKAINLISTGMDTHNEGDHNKENVHSERSGSSASVVASDSQSRNRLGSLKSEGQDDMHRCVAEKFDGDVDDEDDSYMKIEKIDVERDVAAASARMMAHGRNRPMRNRYINQTSSTSSGSDSSTSQGANSNSRRSHSVSEPSAGTAMLAVPAGAVGEVKGWFANLFNWKAQQYVLHSVENCLATRDEAARVLQLLGCHVILEDAQGWGVLRCRMDEVLDMNTGAVTMKSVRFRVEFSPILGYTHPVHLHVPGHHPQPVSQPSGSGASVSNPSSGPGPVKRVSVKGLVPFAS